MLLGVIQIQYAQNIKISGFIKDKKSGENLVGATIFNTETARGGVSNEQGYFSFSTLSPAILKISYIGYQSLNIPLNIHHDTLLQIQLIPIGKELEGVEVQGVRKTEFNISKLSTAQINAFPSITGKPDVIKTLQMMPGFQTQGEGSSVLMVRGGNPSENQFMLDNIPLLYVNHLSGYFSVFNSDIIQNIEAFKGGFPPRYGGKLSSMINIAQKQGELSHIKGNLSIGISDISFSMEGPIAKNASFIIAGRKTFIDAYYALTTQLQSSGVNSFFIYGFHDINAKFSWTPDTKNHFDLSIYQGDDYLSGWNTEKDNRGKQKQHTAHTWGNVLGSAHWKRSFSPKWYMDNSLSFTRYRLKEKASIKFKPMSLGENINNIYISAVQESALRSHWQYTGNEKWNTNFGLQLSYFNFTEGTNTLDAGIYWDNTLSLAKWLELNLGFRTANFTNQNYTNFSFEPRASLNFQIGPINSIGLAYTRMTQNLQMVSVQGALLNNEIWFSSGPGIPTSYSNQYTIGWQSCWNRRMFETELNIYYKDFYNLSTLKDGYASIKGDPYWQKKIAVDGQGTAYGLEFLFRKVIGVWTGFASYTYSRSFRNFAELNQGKTYVFEYDRPHSATLGINWQVNNKWNLSLTWIYQTGQVYTPAIGRISVPSMNEGDKDFYEVLVYGERNSARMRDFHRMDFSAQYNFITKRGHRACWTFSINNVYNRHNPTYYFYDKANDKNYKDWSPQYDPLYNDFEQLALYQTSLFCLIPMVSYRIYFD